MPQQTDYHSFDIPVPFDISNEDTNVWGDILNSAFRHLDEEAIRRGTSSDQPTPQSDGRLFLDTADLRLQYDTGSNWEYVGAQAEFLDSQSHVLTTPKEIDFDSNISVSKSGTNRVKVDVDDAFVQRTGDTMSGDLNLQTNRASFTVPTGDASNVVLGVGTGYNVYADDDGSGTAGTRFWINSPDGGEINVGPRAAADFGQFNIYRADTKLGGDLTATGGEVIWDEAALHIPAGRVEQGTGSTLDADTVDTYEAADLAVRAENETIGGKWDFTAAPTAPNPSSQTEVATKEYVDSTAQSLEYKESVLAEQNTPPSSPADGDRYLVDDSPSGDWSGHPNELAEYDGGDAVWVFNVPNEGWSVFIEDVDSLKTYNGTDWVSFGSTLDHGALQGLGDDDHTQYLHQDGRRGLTGTLDAGNNGIVSIGNVQMQDSAGDGDIWQIRESGSTGDLDFRRASDNVLSFRAVMGGGIKVYGDISNGTTTIWDETNGYIPETSVQQGAGSGLDADTVDGYEAADLRNDKNHAQLTSTDTATDINTTGWVAIPWNKEYNLDAAFSHDSTNSPEVITFDEAGTYRVTASVAYDTSGADVNPGLKLYHNATRLNTFGMPGVVTGTNGHTEASNVVVRTITVASGDTLEIQATAMGNTTPSATMRSEESILEIEQLSASASFTNDANTLDGYDSSQFLRSDVGDTLDGELGLAIDGSGEDAVHITDASGGTSTAPYMMRYDTRDVEFSAGGTTTALSLNQSGQVGVGTAAPSYALDVSGTVFTSGGLLAGGTVDLQSNALANVSTATVEQYQDLEPQAEPAAPAGDTKRMFVDSADGGLKVKDSTGDVTTIAK